MKVYLVAEEDGYDLFIPKAIYSNEDAAQAHSNAIDDQGKSSTGKQVDYGQIYEFELKESFQPPA